MGAAVPQALAARPLLTPLFLEEAVRVRLPVVSIPPQTHDSTDRHMELLLLDHIVADACWSQAPFTMLSIREPFEFLESYGTGADQ